MKILQFFVLLLCDFVISIAANGNDRDAEPPENVIVSINFGEPEEFPSIAELKLLPDSYVANENLPVWIAHAQNPKILEPLSQVMDDIGPFSMYHDVDKCTAAVYFHKRRQFDGTLKIRTLLRNANYDPQTKLLKIFPSNFGISTAPFHQEETSITGDLTGIYEEEAQQIVKEQWKFVKSHLPYPNVVYIEILVFVNYDFAAEFGYDYASIVSHILVTFNSVDMLYSRAEIPKIKINIAGIIIGEERNSFPQLVRKNCYQQYNGNLEGIRSGCTLEAIRSTLNDYYDTITIHSYDVVIFLTSTHLIQSIIQENGTAEMRPIAGIATFPVIEDEGYDGYRSSPSYMEVATIFAQDKNHYCFLPIAHELAHLLHAYHHQGQFRDVDGVCTGNVMRSPGDACEKCLYFSDVTLQEFKDFFSSRDGCKFHNEPKSLYDPISRPRLFWSQDEQCQCYGYEHAYRPRMQSFKLSCIHMKKTNIDCTKKLKCVRHENSVRFVDKTTYLMDGTPCEQNDKVCWDWKCRPIMN